MNFAESNALELEFAKAGILPASGPERADYIILNTCSVRQTAENRIWGRLGFFQHLKGQRSFQLILIGCMAERLKAEVKRRVSAVDYVFGTNDKLHLLDLIAGRESGNRDEYQFTSSYQGSSSSKALLPIMNGCSNFCAYCIVPYVRGREVSRDPADILVEVGRLREAGIREITLLGQNVNSYRWESSSAVMQFPELLAAVSEAAGEDIWLRFLSPHPKDFSPQLIELIAARRNICSHIHLPLQSGSDRVLKAMRRVYTSADYRRLTQALRNADAEVTFSTDILVGFPGETDEDFRKTLDMVDEVGFLDAFMYYFNPREGTEAMGMEGHLSDEVKLARLRELIEFQRSQVLSVKKNRIGRRERALAEGVSKRNVNKRLARTEHDEIVLIPGESAEEGQFVDVTITGLMGTTYEGAVSCHGKPFS